MQEIADDSLTTQVHRRLRADLLRGVVAPGAKLKVQAIAASYGAGASPVREALSSLAAEGLVERLDQRGFRAATATVAEFDELVLARCLLEEVVLRESLSAGGQGWEEALVLAGWRLGRLRRDDPAWEDAHTAFHQALLAACPSPTLCTMAEALREKAERYRNLANRVAYPGRDVAAEHAAIAEAALGRDTARAIHLLREHYRSTAGFLREALRIRDTGGAAVSAR